MSTTIIGYSAASVSMIAFGTQFVHTIRCGSIEGISVGRTVLDTVSLVLWVAYATRVEDIPLLIATGCELFLSVCVCAIILKHHTQKIVICGPKQNPTSIVIIQSSKPYEIVSISLTSCKTQPPLDEGKTLEV
jgi:uncharacterized protein with PQ loop repeat